MKQRISVRAIVKDGEKILLLRRAIGRPSAIGMYELPGGLLDDDEQPEAALARHLLQQTGFEVQTAQLTDVVSYRDDDGREIQHLAVLYTVGIELHRNKVIISKNYDHYTWCDMQLLQRNDVKESTKILLGIVQQSFSSVSLLKKDEGADSISTDVSDLIIYSDGGSRGNPGPSAAGFVVMDTAGRVIHEGGMYLGITTNNQAEYHGVRLGLEKARELGARRVDFRIDSMLVVNQMNGLYTIKNRELWPIHERIQELVVDFDKVTFTHVKRELNQLADGMVNKILNAHDQE